MSVRAAGLIDGYERTITGRVFALARVSRNELVEKKKEKENRTSIKDKSFEGGTTSWGLKAAICHLRIDVVIGINGAVFLL